jgi:hypothetical protein
MSTQYANGKIVTSGLVLALDAADRNSYPGSGTTWRDLTENNYSGSLVNGPTFSSANGGSIVFDGTNDYANFGNPSTLNIPNNVTVNIWFKINAITDTAFYKGIIAKRVANSYTNYAFNFVKQTAGQDLFQWYYNTNSTTFRILSVTLSSYFSIGVLYNVCGTFSQNSTNTDAKLYKNASLIASNTLSENIAAAASSNLILGSTLDNAEPFNGSIANAQIYNRALSATEVLQNYNAQKSRFNLK